MPKKKKDNIIIEDNENMYTLIFLHGLGDEGSSWIFFARELKKYIKNLRVILPSAGENLITINTENMTSWFDITEYPITKNYSDNGKYKDKTEEKIINLIDKEIKSGIKMENILLGGYSQGAAMALDFFLNHNLNFGGIIVLSGWLINKIISNNQGNNNIPIFIGHGEKDEIVLFENAISIKQNLEKNGINNLEYKTYPNMKHNTSTNEINDIIRWFNKRVKL